MGEYGQTSGPIWLRLWESLGGWKTLKEDLSPYAAFVATILLWPFWRKPMWWDDVLSITSILVGFSWSAFALVIALIEPRRARFMRREEPNKPSSFLKLYAAFAYYILLGFTAIGFALVSKAWYQPEWLEPITSEIDRCWFSVILDIFRYPLWFVGWFFFSYCICSGVRTVFFLFKMATVAQLIFDHESALLASKDERGDKK